MKQELNFRFRKETVFEVEKIGAKIHGVCSKTN